MEIFLIMFIVAAYFLPAIIAGSRGHKNGAPIFLTNLFLGMTGIGWVAALIWSFSDNVLQYNGREK